MKKLISILAIGGLSALNMMNYSCKNDKTPEVPKVREEAPVVNEAPSSAVFEPKTYVVSQGDYLSKIVYENADLNGKSLYEKVSDVQGLNWDANEISKRDLQKTVDGKLVSGKDGYVDLIYPGEELKLE